MYWGRFGDALGVHWGRIGAKVWSSTGLVHRLEGFLVLLASLFFEENNAIFFYRERLERLLRNVKCEIISMSQNGQVDAYVLSESSMFVSQRRFLLKTCGTTTPLECIRDLVVMAKQYTGFDTIEVFIEKVARYSKERPIKKSDKIQNSRFLPTLLRT